MNSVLLFGAHPAEFKRIQVNIIFHHRSQATIGVGVISNQLKHKSIILLLGTKKLVERLYSPLYVPLKQSERGTCHGVGL